MTTAPRTPGRRPGRAGGARLARAAALAGAGVLAAAAAGAAQGSPDPFAPGLRWSVAPDAAAPWLPRDVALAADGELVWAAPALGNPHLRLLAASATAPDGPAGATLLTGPALPGAIGVVPVAAGDAAHLYAAPQLPDPDAAHRRTEVVRYDAELAAARGAFVPTWTRVLPVHANGPALLAGDAGAVVAAIHDPAAGAVHLEWIDPATGAPGTAAALPGGPLGALAMASGGARVALTAGQELWIVDADGAVAHHETLASATACLALSADGGTALVGRFGAARVLVAGAGGAFVEAAPVLAGATEIAAHGAVSADGGCVAVGFWDFASGSGVRVVWRETAGALLLDAAWTGAGVLQDYPQELALTPDGERLAVGLWGQAGAEPEVLLYRRGQTAPAFAWSLPGSPMALALAADGTRVAVARKSAHANQFATTGAIELLDTGERDLQLVAAARPGGALELAFLHPGAQQAVFGVGTPADPVPLPGVAGVLHLAPTAPLLAFPAPADAAGRADLTLPLPPGPALVGLGLGCQAVAVTGGGPALSDALLVPAIL